MKHLLVVLCVIGFYSAQAQTGLSIYPFSNQVGCVVQTPKLGVEFKAAFSNTNADEANILIVSPQLDVNVNLFKNDYLRFTGGVGAGFGYITDNNNYWSVQVPFKLMVQPFEKIHQVYIVSIAELQMKQFTGFSTTSINTGIGIGFYFKK